MIERFWAKVDIRGPHECWEWRGATARHGYGAFTSRSYRVLPAHRIAYELATATEIPAGMVVMHSCDNVACVNPAHLSLGTQQDNLRDMAAKDRSTRGERNAQAKLTAADVRDIRGRTGQTQGVIAAEYGVSRRLIGLILRGQRWAHV